MASSLSNETSSLSYSPSPIGHAHQGSNSSELAHFSSSKKHQNSQRSDGATSQNTSVGSSSKQANPASVSKKGRAETSQQRFQQSQQLISNANIHQML
jgi:hypothetical protein